MNITSSITSSTIPNLPQSPTSSSPSVESKELDADTIESIGTMMHLQSPYATCVDGHIAFHFTESAPLPAYKEKSSDELQKLAQNNDLEALFALGERSKNLQEKLNYVTKAADGGLIRAQNFLAASYKVGHGGRGKIDSSLAFK
jgi:hypothetical protein